MYGTLEYDVKRDKYDRKFFSKQVCKRLKINTQIQTVGLIDFFSKLFYEIKCNNFLRETNL